MSVATPDKEQGIDYFNRGHWLTRAQTVLSLAARRRMFQHYLAYAGEAKGKAILDIGATPDLVRADSNCFVPWFHGAGLSVALYSPEDISGLQVKFPYVSILPTAGFGAQIPAPNRHYDWVSASAVLEHVGSFEKQVAFIEDCARVGGGLFLTTPNRHHWLEFHTKLPMLHWLPKAFHRKLLKSMGMRSWAREDHLNLMGQGELAAAARRALGREFSWEIRTVWSLGMPSNLILLAKRN